MKVWIVVLAILLLLSLIVREKFETYEEALQFAIGKSPEYVLPRCESGFTLSSNKDSCEKTNSDGTKEKKQPTCPSGTKYTVRGSQGNCEPIGVASPTDESIDPKSEVGDIVTLPELRNTRCPEGYTKISETGPTGQTIERCKRMTTPTCYSGYKLDGSMCKSVDQTNSTEHTPECPAGSFLRGSTCVSYKEPESLDRQTSDSPYVGGGGSVGPAGVPNTTTYSGGSSAGSTCPSGYTLAPSNAPFGLAGKCTKSSGTMPCPEGEFMPGGPGDDTSKCVKRLSGNDAVQTSNVPTCPSGQTATPIGCMMVSEPSSSGSGGNTTTSGSWNASLGGGSSGNLFGPNSGGTGSSKLIWGPVFTGLGEDTTGGSGDTTKSNQYPELMGGLFGKTSSRIPGVGIVSPSQPGLDTSVLPSSASTGTDANARFLPFSRQPGDMDIVPDPYRLASSYSTKNYAPQKDPVPFLTDFSAFFK